MANDSRATWRPFAAALPLAFLFYAALDGRTVGGAALWAATAHTVRLAAFYGAPVAVWGALVVVSRAVSGRAGLALHVASSVGLTLFAFAVLRGDTLLASHPAVLTVLVIAPVAAVLEWFGPRLRRAARSTLGTTLLGAATAATIANGRMLVATYPELHYLLCLAALAASFLGLGYVISVVPSRVDWRAGIAVWVITLAVGASSLATPDARRHVLADTSIGWSGVALSAASSPPRPETDFTRDDALAAFREHHRLFQLPDDFALADWDILFIASESTRFDETTLANPDRATTPHLARLVEDGAMSFADAHAPSSGTLQTLASWFSMRPVSAAPVDIWRPRWTGTLRAETETVAELLAARGRHTFWIGHNFRGLFDRTLEGFEQGFAEVERPAERSPAEDLEIGDGVVRALHRLADEERYFGFVMFSSPHFQYHAHFEEMPATTPRERYRQELRLVDQQLGRIVDALRDTGRLDHTVVVFTGDHGEELGDHGSMGHNRSLHEESLHVPLVVWFPGARRTTDTGPVSNAWVLPRLLLDQSERARDAIASGWGPFMAATDGSVVAELLGHSRHRVALIDARRKLVHDVPTDRTIAYDRRVDPGEKTPDYAPDAAALGRLNTLLSVRQRQRQFRLVGRRKSTAPDTGSNWP